MCPDCGIVCCGAILLIAVCAHFMTDFILMVRKLYWLVSLKTRELIVLKLTHRLIFSLAESTGKANESYITWAPMLGKMNYNEEKNAIVIPTTGIYFIYLRFTLSCNDDVKDSEFQKFHIQLHRWSEAYGKVTTELDAWESVKCQAKDYQTLFVGQLFDRLDGEFLSVKVIDGYNLIKKSFFGAFLQ
uniref:THD domain-containing protein n=1 Tax=Neolamprologus brichardi TaxID=32507 RepID=A0A3Q4MAG0_NEOBR